jgi:large subunit ribosomal protein L22
MKKAAAYSNYIRISPRKARLAADLIRKMNVDQAMVQLGLCNLRGGRLLQKTLNSAIANAETQQDVQRRDLIVKEVRVDAGPTLKRAKSKSRGGKVPIMKRTSHFTVIVGTEG